MNEGGVDAVEDSDKACTDVVSRFPTCLSRERERETTSRALRATPGVVGLGVVAPRPTLLLVARIAHRVGRNLDLTAHVYLYKANARTTVVSKLHMRPKYSISKSLTKAAVNNIGQIGFDFKKLEFTCNVKLLY